MPNNFLIYAFTRTGSYHLMSLLDSAPDIVCHGEVFKDNRVELRRWHRRQALTLDPSERDVQPEAFLQQLRELNPYKHFGFKVLLEHAQRVPALQALLDSPHWLSVCLVRDPLEIYASLRRAEITGKWSKRSDANEDADILIRFESDDFAKFIQRYSCYIESVWQRFKRPRCMIVRYNDINHVETLNKLLTFLESRAQATDLTSEYRRQSFRGIDTAFENHRDMVDYVSQVQLPVLPPTS